MDETSDRAKAEMDLRPQSMSTLVPMTSTTRFVAVIGDPIEHSLSPVIHNAAFQAQRLDFAYVALRVSSNEIHEAVAGLRALGFAGANVTAPHKQAVIPEVDRVSTQARAIGAVNTIVPRIKDGRTYLEGDNTDVVGFLAPLLDHAHALQGAAMTLLGSGGAARAVAYALLTTFKPEQLILAVRTPENGERLASDLAGFDEASALRVQPMAESRSAIRSSKIVVNATPIGTFPDVDASPWTDAGDFGADQIIYDLVYNPRETRLLLDAAERGATTIDGLTMLIAQAAASYVQWTGREMPENVAREALRARTAL